MSERILADVDIFIKFCDILLPILNQVNYNSEITTNTTKNYHLHYTTLVNCENIMCACVRACVCVIYFYVILLQARMTCIHCFARSKCFQNVLNVC